MTEPKIPFDSQIASKVGQVADDFLHRCSQGEMPDVEEYAQNHPEIADVLRQMLPALQLLAAPDSVAKRTEEFFGAAVSTDAQGPSSTRREPIATAPPPGYEILGEVGRGGMGVVFKARQVSLDRIVALKMIRSGALAEGPERERFRTEALAVAQVQHPNIVQIFEVGDHNGSPFCAFEFVEKGSLADKLKGEPQAPEWAAEQTEILARAIQVVHDRDLVHRDLKPSNILVSADDVLKISDFGLVKRVKEPGLTQSGMIVGTPTYLSPEQAGGKDGSVGPASDVYALGVILYEMLTGRPPFKGTTTIETLIQVREKEPIPPRQLQPNCPKDLETICLKCLEKDPQRRYPSAADLADDLRRFLDGRPILARPIGPVGRTIRWCRRNPVVASLAALSALILIAGTAISLFFGIQANNNANLANARADLLEKKSLELQQSLDLGKKSINNYVDTVLADELLGDIRFQPLRKKLLKDALAYYQRFIQEHEHEKEMRAELAEAVLRVADISQESGSSADAIAAYLQAADLYRQLQTDSPATKWSRQLGKIHNQLGVLYRQSNQLDKAKSAIEQAAHIFEQLAKTHENDTEIHNDLASTHGHLGVFYKVTRKPNDALVQFKKTLLLQKELVQADPDNPSFKENLAKTYGNLANLYFITGKRREAVDAGIKALKIFQDLARANPSDDKYQALLASALGNTGVLYKFSGRVKEALAASEQAVEIGEQLVRKHPHVIKYQDNLGQSYNNAGGLYSEIKQHKKALAALQAAAAIYQRLARENPENVPFAMSAAQCYSNEGEILRNSDQAEKSLPLYRKAIAELQAVRKKKPGYGTAQYFLAMSFTGLAAAYSDLKRHDDSIAVCEQALESDLGPFTAKLRALLAVSLARAGKHARAASEAGRVASNPKADPETVYTAAAAFARSIQAVAKDEVLDTDKKKSLAGEFGKRAVQLLDRARTMGYFRDPRHLRKLMNGRDFAAIQQRQDFASLLTRIKSR